MSSPSGAAVTWPRMVGTTTGDTLYCVAAANGTVSGISIPVVFNRSTDGGATWDIVNQIPSGLDATKFVGLGGDSYAIAAHGPVVAIVAGDIDSDVALIKSTDGGVTWTTNRTIYRFPLPLYNSKTTKSDINNDGIQDTVLTNDGIFAIALDNSNSAHVFFGRTYMTGDGSTGSFLFYGVDGLCYWNESMADGVANTDPDVLSSNAIVVASVTDLNGNNKIDVGQPSSGVGYGKYRGSLTSYASCAFDAQNNLYLSYSSLNDTLKSYINPDKNVRHVYVTKRLASAINPDDFCTPVELDLYDPNQGNILEGMYASMAKRVDGNVHLVYMRDFAPGHGVPPSSGTNDDQSDNHQQASEIVYAKIPVSDLTNCPIPTGIKDVASSVAHLNFYPNPTSSNGTIEVVLNENAKMDIAVLNSVGQTVYSTSVSGNAGSNKVDVNLSNLSSGLYFYQVRIANSKAITKKFAVEK
ncbi:MAG: T9SS type A sorting domain-containing protein [Bacteroidetes bacterium]|nr:T9SS type A sorting domain-containing protein [Bacteroidota bacterium]